MGYAPEHNLRSTARELCETSRQGEATSTHNTVCGSDSKKANRENLAALIEARLVAATWTLRRMPDRERGFLNMRGSLWPETHGEKGCYPTGDLTPFNVRRRAVMSPKEIDQMQPALDLLLLLPDIRDRQIVFWAAWHQNGEVQVRIPWTKVRRSLVSNASRWTLKRHYEGGLAWLAALIEIQS